MKLGTRYFIAFAAIAASALTTLGVIDAVGDFRRQVSYISELQTAEARMVATRIAAYLDDISRQIAAVHALPWEGGPLSPDDRRAEFHRLLKLNPAIHELRVMTVDGNVVAFVSRVAPDSTRTSTARAVPLQDRENPERLRWYGPVYFEAGSTPYVSLTVRNGRPGSAEVLVAEIDLRYVTDLIASVHPSGSGRAFVIDGADHLVAHPNLSLLHRKVDLTSASQVRAARAQTPAAHVLTVRARSPESSADVLTSAALVPVPGWLVFVEQPFSQVMAPVWATIMRTAGILGLLLAVALVVSRYLANKLTEPILVLQRSAARITSGDLSTRVVRIGSNDEIAALGTQFNRMAASLGRSHAELEGLVEVRTGQLADANRKVQEQADELALLNRELELQLEEVAVKKDEAERANAAKTRFLAAASHDLRQPMQAISLLMEVLRERIGASELRMLADKVQGSVNALETLFVSLLDISRLDQGVIRPQLQDFRIGPLLATLRANFLPQAMGKGLRLNVVACDAAVRSDPALLERILGNLVSNAIRYTASGGIAVGCRRRGHMLRIAVYDTGVGVPAHLQGEIFEEFFQVGNPERDRAKGLGLGLSIVKRTAEILEHPLAVRSQVNRGSMFAIDVPLAHADPAALRTQLSVRSGQRLAGTFVVVIDDERENRFAIETLCAQWGCHVVGAGSTDHALGSLQHHLRSPDLIITDYRLRADETGIDAVRRIRELLDDPVPAIVITGDMAIHATNIAGEGDCALLYKPINADKLWRTAEALLSRARAKTAGALTHR